MNIKKLNEELKRLLNEDEVKTTDKFDGFIIFIYPESGVGRPVLYCDPFIDSSDYQYYTAGTENPKCYSKHCSSFNEALEVGLKAAFKAFPNIDCETTYKTRDDNRGMMNEDYEDSLYPIYHYQLCRGTIFDTVVNDWDRYLGMLYISGFRKI